MMPMKWQTWPFGITAGPNQRLSAHTACPSAAVEKLCFACGIKLQQIHKDATMHNLKRISWRFMNGCNVSTLQLIHNYT